MLKLVPDVVNNQTLRAVQPKDSALDAARLMTEFDISAVIVNDDEGQLTGIVTERDLSRRVVANDREASATPIAEIMTANPTTLAPDDSVYDAMQVMRRLKVRHLPVTTDGKVVAMVSVRDLRHAIAHEVEPAHNSMGASFHRWLRRLGI